MRWVQPRAIAAVVRGLRPIRLEAMRRMRDFTCDRLGHAWDSGENEARRECLRCRRRSYMLVDAYTGEISWIVGN
jgi:hypothetical protein